jgi:YD repeat-containing protein
MKKLSPVLFTAALAALPTAPAQAEVNIKDASFSQRWIDLQIGQHTISRTYESRSTHNGIFGFGWCSPIETRLKVQGDRLKLNQCGSETVFERRASGYRAAAPGLGSIFKVGALSKRNLIDGSSQTFDAEGKLIGWRAAAAASGELRIFYDGEGLPQEVLAPTGEVLRFRTDPITRRVIKIEATGGRNVDYVYEGDDLVKIRNAWNNTYSYRYDKLHNLTRIDYPDSTYDLLTYNSDRDWVTSFKARNGCNETYSYSKDANREVASGLTSVIKASAKSIKTCDGHAPAETSFEFSHRKLAGGSTYLAATRITAGNQVTQTLYHPVTGEVTLMLRQLITKGSAQ